MPADVSWNEVRQGGLRLPGPDRLGGWAVAAMLVSLALHLVLFFLLDRMDIGLRFHEARELSTAAIRVPRVEVRPPEAADPVATPEVRTPPDASSLLEEIDLLAKVPEEKIEIRPDIDEAVYELKISQPKSGGESAPEAPARDRDFEIDSALPDLGREPEMFQPSQIGRMTVDPGTPDDADSSRVLDTLGRPETGVGKGPGLPDGIASIDQLLDLPPNLLLSSKTMLPGDLLFEFNRAELRESAKVGLMKVALLMDRNPGLFCWIEGHADLVGSDAFNLDLSKRRADAVRDYLVESLRMDGAKIITRGYGRMRPIIAGGDEAAQAVNRRVEIKMRKTADAGEPLLVPPPRAVEVPEPRDAVPREVVPPPARPVVPKAVPVEDAAPRAVPIDEEVPPLRALPAEFRGIPRAEAVEE